MGDLTFQRTEPLLGFGPFLREYFGPRFSSERSRQGDLGLANNRPDTLDQSGSFCGRLLKRLFNRVEDRRHTSGINLGIPLD